MLIADCFRTEAYSGRKAHGVQPGGGHSVKAFCRSVEASPFAIAAEEDITDAVAPSIDLEQQLFNVLGHGFTRVSDEIQGKRRLVHWALSRLLGLFLSAKRRRNLMQRLTGTSRSSSAFLTYNRYQIVRLQRKPAQTPTP